MLLSVPVRMKLYQKYTKCSWITLVILLLIRFSNQM